MLPPAAERPKLETVLDRLSAAVEDLLLGGLTTASDSTRQAITVAMQEAARSRLLRLGSSLRAASEELGRFTRQEPSFSLRRLTFFLNRAWLLSRGIAQALRSADEALYDRLAWSRPAEPLPDIEVACLGVLKKVAAGAFVAFEFRLRSTVGSSTVAAGERFTWSAVFPLKAGMEVQPEGFLHLSQKQKFVPNLFLGGTTVVIRGASASADDSGNRRIALTDESTVTAGRPFTDWERFLEWSPTPASERLRRHKPGPLDLDTELQEEVVLRDYQIGPPCEADEPGQVAFPIATGPLGLRAVVGSEAEGKALKKGLDDLRKLKKDRPPLFGLMHYERCRMVLQPLTAFGEAGPDYLTISKEIVNKAALLKAISFT